MWVLVFFDLPVVTESDKRTYTHFRKKLLKDGFDMFQFSIYLRHCASQENADVHIKRVKKILPKKGKVGILRITDKQFGMMEIFEGTEQMEAKPPPQQLEMF
jgi:CRISPR-associated protein Cas2